MIDWTKGMQQVFEYYVVNPLTWKDEKPINNIVTNIINHNLNSETVSNCSLSAVDFIGEFYIRVYIKVTQNKETLKQALGTFLVQTPSDAYDGKKHTVTVEAYSPLLELKENRPPLGYSVLKNTNVMDIVYKLTKENLRAPVVFNSNNKSLEYDFVMQKNDTWLSFLIDLMASINCRYTLDEYGRVLFQPIQNIESLQPIVTYSKENSILYPDISIEKDMYNIPNRIEVTYSSASGVRHSIAVNNDNNSPTSVQARGRYITIYDDNPDLVGEPSQEYLDEYAKNKLKSLSIIKRTISYTHAYYPSSVGDCVRLNYPEYGLDNVKAMIISQHIKCEPGCPVQEQAIVTTNLWR